MYKHTSTRTTHTHTECLSALSNFEFLRSRGRWSWPDLSLCRRKEYSNENYPNIKLIFFFARKI